jgi:hypothetical protein
MFIPIILCSGCSDLSKLRLHRLGCVFWSSSWPGKAAAAQREICNELGQARCESNGAAGHPFWGGAVRSYLDAEAQDPRIATRVRDDWLASKSEWRTFRGLLISNCVSGFITRLQEAGTCKRPASIRLVRDSGPSTSALAVIPITRGHPNSGRYSPVPSYRVHAREFSRLAWKTPDRVARSPRPLA